MDTISIFIAIALIIYISLKGISILIAAPVASILVILLNKLNIFDVLLGSGSGTYIDLWEHM